MVPGAHGHGWMPFGDAYLFESIDSLNALDPVALEIDFSITTAMGMAPFDRRVLELESQPLSARAMAPITAIAFTLDEGPTYAMGMAPLGAPGFTLTPQATAGMALAGFNPAHLWLIPWLGVSDAVTGATVLAINASTLAVTEYSLSALDVLEHEGEVWFVTATGLSKLADGAGVSGTITTGDLELSDGSISLNLARLELEADGELHITATAHQDGGQRTTRYLVPKRTGANERDRNVKLGNGVLGNDWSFTIAPPTGQVCNWSLGGWKIEPGQYKLRRR